MTQDARSLLYSSGGAFPQVMVTGYDDVTSSFNTLRINQEGHLTNEAYVWDTNSMSWVPAETTNGVSIVGVTNATDTRINPATEESLSSLVGFDIPPYDFISLGYNGSDLTTVTYKVGGSGGTAVATLTLGYTGVNLSSIARS